MQFEDGQQVIVLLVVGSEEQIVFIVIENGYGKCMLIIEYMCYGCGMKGMIVIQMFECNGKVVVVMFVDVEDQIMLIMMVGVLICICVFEICEMGCVM